MRGRELHGGSISASSEGPGRGSRFTVRLPAIDAGTESTGGPRTHDAAQGMAKRILLADDNVDYAASMALILEAMGHDVRVANDGEQAVALAQIFSPQIAFLDIGLPTLSGYALARRLRTLPETRKCILVAVTGWGQEDDKRNAREAGFDHHLVKPVEPEQMHSIVDSVR